MKYNKLPKKDQSFIWTKHIAQKMVYYQISPQTVRRIIKSPQRREVGIAPQTIAVMQSRGRVRKTEIWVMYQEIVSAKQLRKVLISTWRYPGVSPKGQPFKLPANVETDLVNYFKRQRSELNVFNDR